jgi:ElaB/YqjD/DUF883 family membrane-anchored ribosome-binding protein
MVTTEINSKAADAALRSEVEALRAELANLHEQMRSFGTSAARTAKAGVRDARAHLHDAVGSAKEHGKNAAESLEAKVEEHPLVSLGVAFGVGLIVGVILRK